MRHVRWMALAGLVLMLGCQGKAREPSPPPAAGGSASAGVQWQTKFEQAMQQAKQEGKPVLMDMGASWCSACKRLDAEVWPRGDVGELSKRFVAVKVDGDERTDLKAKFGIAGFPTVIFFSPDGKEISRVLGAVPYESMLTAMQDALAGGKTTK